MPSATNDQPSTSTPNMPRKKRYVLAVSGMALALFAIVAAAKRQNDPADLPANTLRTATAVIGDVEASVMASGTLQASDLINVGAQVSGQVTSLKVTLGQHVNKGELIAEVDSTTQKNELRNAEAGLKSLAAQMRAKQTALQQAESTLKRQKLMLEQDASSRADYESAEAAWHMARTDVTALEAQIEQAQLQAERVKLELGRTSIRAPMEGTVVAIVTKEGQTLNAAQQVPTIVKLAHLDSLQVKTQISEVDVARVKAGMPVSFSLMGEPERRYQSRLKVVEPVPETASQEMPGGGGGSGAAVYYNAAFNVPNPEGKLRIGMTVQTFIVLASARKVVTVPLAALGEKRTDGRYVVQVMNNNKPEEREVKIGVQDGMNAEIIEGLKAGEPVVLQSDAAPSSAMSASSAGAA